MAPPPPGSTAAPSSPVFPSYYPPLLDYHSTTRCGNCRPSVPASPTPPEQCGTCHKNCPPPPTGLQRSINPIFTPLGRMRDYLENSVPIPPLQLKTLDLGIRFFIDRKALMAAFGAYVIHEHPSIPVTVIPPSVIAWMSNNSVLSIKPKIEQKKDGAVDVQLDGPLLSSEGIRGGFNLSIENGRLLFEVLNQTTDVSFFLLRLPVAYHKQTGEPITYFQFTSLETDKLNDYRFLRAPLILVNSLVQRQRLPESISISDLFETALSAQEASHLLSTHHSSAKMKSVFGRNIFSSIGIDLNVSPLKLQDERDELDIKFNPSDLKVNLNASGSSDIPSIQGNGHIHIASAHLGPMQLKDLQVDLSLNFDPQKEVSGLDFKNIKGTIEEINLGPLKIKGSFDSREIEILNTRRWGPDQFQIKGSIRLYLTVTLPVLGEVTLDPHIDFQTSIKKKGGSFGIVPHSTQISIPNLELKSSDQKTIVSLLDIYISDTKVAPSEDLSASAKKPGLQINFRVSQLGNTSFKNESHPAGSCRDPEAERLSTVQLFIPIPMDDSGDLYNLASLAKSPGFEGKVNLQGTDGSKIAGDFSLSTTTSPTSPKTYLLQTSLKGPDLLIDSGNLRVSAANHSFDVSLSAESLTLGPVSIHTPHLNTRFSIKYNDDQTLQFTMSQFDMVGNSDSTHLPRTGLTQGPLSLKLEPSEKEDKKSPLSIILVPSRNYAQLNLNHRGLNFKIERITIPGLRELTHGKITGIDMQGRIEGNFFNMEFINWRGSGELTLQSNNRNGAGDIFLRGTDGERIRTASVNPAYPHRVYTLPFLAGDKLVLRRINGIDTKRERILCDAEWTGILDPRAIEEAAAPHFHIDIYGRLILRFTNLPYTARGWSKMIADYLSQQGREP